MKIRIALLTILFLGCAEMQESAKKNQGAKSDCSADAKSKKKSFQMRNGSAASESDYPFMGMVYAKNMRILAFPPLQTTQKSCSGTLVCRNVVLTAGHCIADGELARNFTFHPSAKPGDTPQVTLATARGLEYKVLSKAGAVGRKDIALLKLDRDLKIKPARIWLKSFPDESLQGGVPVKIVGYGNSKNEAGKDSGDGVRRIGDMVYMGEMERPGAEETHQMAILHPSQGLNAPRDKSTNACSGDSGGAAIVGDRIYGVLAKIMHSKDGKTQAAPNCAEANVTLAAVLARQKNWLAENLEKMCSGDLDLDDDSPPFEPLAVTADKPGSTPHEADGLLGDEPADESPCE